jgi:hypothetical protein
MIFDQKLLAMLKFIGLILGGLFFHNLRWKNIRFGIVRCLKLYEKKNIVRPSRGHRNFSLLEILDTAGIVSDI